MADAVRSGGPRHTAPPLLAMERAGIHALAAPITVPHQKSTPIPSPPIHFCQARPVTPGAIPPGGHVYVSAFGRDLSAGSES